jgi:hypothetical protein
MFRTRLAMVILVSTLWGSARADVHLDYASVDYSGLRLEPGGALDELIVGAHLVLNWIPPNADIAPNKMTERMYGNVNWYDAHDTSYTVSLQLAGGF